jgi:hypothetical protein
MGFEARKHTNVNGERCALKDGPQSVGSSKEVRKELHFVGWPRERFACVKLTQI